MMWVLLAVSSALGLGIYDVCKKLSVQGNNVLIVLMLNTLFSAMLMAPALVTCVSGDMTPSSSLLQSHLLILVKAFIVLGSWLLGYFAIKHLPLTIQGPINASRPVMVLVGAVLIFGEQLNTVQWLGILLGFLSLFMISRIGHAEGFSMRRSRWLWMSIGAAMLGAVSALFDKYLLRLYQPLYVQSLYSIYQCVIMVSAIVVMRKIVPIAAGVSTRFVWRWSIPLISLFLTAADLAYFYALSLPGAMISIVSMIRRGSVIVPFLYGVFALHERHIRAKIIDLGILLLSLSLLVIGSSL